MINILCPALHKTGGTEALHQLAKVYKDNNIPSRLIYVDGNKKHPEFDIYDVIISTTIEDEVNSFFIIPEVFANKFSFKNAKKIIWWLSVDNYKSRYNEPTVADIHLYQSEYARLYLAEQNYNPILPLSDYINDIFMREREIVKEDIICYNPAKTPSFIQKLIDSKEFNFKGLAGLSTTTTRDLLLRSKVYIDFGNHPGKDRIPREAALSNCCIITGKRGSAGNSIDIDIPLEYKLEEDINKITSKLKECVDNYERHIGNFSSYKKKIVTEKDIFVREALTLAKYLCN